MPSIVWHNPNLHIAKVKAKCTFELDILPQHAPTHPNK